MSMLRSPSGQAQVKTVPEKVHGISADPQLSPAPPLWAELGTMFVVAVETHHNEVISGEVYRSEARGGLGSPTSLGLVNFQMG